MEQRAADSEKALKVRRYHSNVSIFIGLVGLFWSLKVILGQDFWGPVVLNWVIAVLVGVIALYHLYVELRGPLISLGQDGITLRDYARPRFRKIEWDRIQEVRGRGRQISRVAILVLRDGGEVEVPVHAVLLPKPDELIEKIQKRVGGGGDARE